MPDTSTTIGKLKDSHVAGQTGQGLELRGTLLKLTRFTVVFELHNPAAVLRTSEVLQEFKIIAADRTLYSGKAVVRSLIHTGPAVEVCEATLNESSWTDVQFTATNGQLGKKISAEYQEFMREWQKLYKVRPEYKLVLADMQTYFTDLRLWLDQVELGVRSNPLADRQALERDIAEKVGASTVATLTTLFDRFEEAARSVEEDLLPSHRVFAKRQLHPLLLCAPFFHRCYVKPLGYAGDYEMVNMMLRNPCEGASLFAKVMNIWFLAQAPVEAHRRRIDYLVKHITQVILRAASEGRVARIISLGCGPAQEVQRFLVESPLCARAEFTMLDFNEETLQYNRAMMNDLKAKHNRPTPFHYIKRSVHHILKETGRAVESPAATKYDLVYCAGLFDYLSDRVCCRLMDVMYDWVRPGGMLLATNVHACNPSIGWMEHVVDWHLIYRNARQMAALVPKQKQSPPDNARILAEPTGVNVFVEVPKPENA